MRLPYLPWNEYGDTAIHFAARKGNIKMFMKLYELGINIHKPKIAYLATENNQQTILEKLNELGVDLDKKIKISSGYSLVHEAVKHGHLQLLTLFHNWGVNMNATDSLSRTAAFSAVTSGNQEALKKLAVLGADMNAKDKNGETLAHIVLKGSRYNLKEKLSWLDLLLKLGASLTETNNYQQQPVDLIKGKRIKETIVKKLKEYEQTSKLEPEKEDSLGSKRKHQNPSAFFSHHPKKIKRDFEDMTAQGINAMNQALPKI